ncbi:hypothetical protein J6590_036935 [Homalodisca vitripennis]|nr:hypothetical protein J6590_036935 [Homalodisca vitripennis]
MRGVSPGPALDVRPINDHGLARPQARLFKRDIGFKNNLLQAVSATNWFAETDTFRYLVCRKPGLRVRYGNGFQCRGKPV